VRQVTLSDNSQLWLNHNTRVDIAFTPQQRRLVLIQGEILLDSSNDPRPLVIETPSGEVRARHGRISVDYQRNGSYVNAMAGDVYVHPRLGNASRLPSGKGVWMRRAGSSWQWSVQPSRFNNQGWPAP
ncbi:iron dicitrate transport regulator FecR, partial [Pseudomonas sp. MAFF212428]